MNNDRAEVDELIFEIADYKNDFADMARKTFEEVLNQLGSLPMPARPHARSLATQQCTSAVATNYQKDTRANTSLSRIRNAHEES
jgi:hypothetical protein